MLHLAVLNLTFGMAEYCSLERRLQRTGSYVRGRTEVGIGRENFRDFTATRRTLSIIIAGAYPEMVEATLRTSGEESSQLFLLLLTIGSGGRTTGRQGGA